MQLYPLALASLIVTGTQALAEDFVPVTDRSRFIEFLGARMLQHPVFGIRLEVTPNGTIKGEALGWAVSGTWAWQDGFFCRQMDWSGTPIPYNCQLVEAAGTEKLRFTTDKGAGDAATFRIE